MLNKKIIYSLILLITFISCSEEQSTSIKIAYNMDQIKNISQNKWDTLSHKIIYFGHQSVGYNMIDGLVNQLKENPNIKLRISEENNSTLFDQSGFVHSKNGKNENPKSKIDGFYDKMVGGLGDKVDIAGFKFCYLDFKMDSDVKEIFKYYKEKIYDISLKYPELKIIHFTVPLNTIQSGPKAFVKKILGKSIGIEDNFTRQKFNKLLVNEFGNQMLFDLAKYESTYPDGKREFIDKNNERIYSLIEAYTYDGGHLSEVGQQYITTQFLIFMAEATNVK